MPLGVVVQVADRVEVNPPAGGGVCILAAPFADVESLKKVLLKQPKLLKAPLGFPPSIPESARVEEGAVSAPKRGAGEDSPNCKNGRCWAGEGGGGGRCCWGANSDEGSSFLLARNIEEAKELPEDDTEAGEGRAPRTEGLLTPPVELDAVDDTGLERLMPPPLLVLLLLLDGWEFLAAEEGVLLGSGAFRLLPLVGVTVPLLFCFFCRNFSMLECLDRR